MSMLIKGINLPKATGFHIITIWSDGTTFTRTIEGSQESRIDEVKAIQISTPHGRLIDADALFQDLREHNIPFNNDINSAINVAPTILEAEK